MAPNNLPEYAGGFHTPEMQDFKAKHAQLAAINTIDALRDVGVGSHVALPQIVVVGAESSGKSSVLSAISRVQFPARGGVCTRFATELSLREANEPNLEVCIRPHADSSSEMKSYLAEFHHKGNDFGMLSQVFDSATKHMKIDDGENIYSKHTLTIRISGPDVPQLTLVDLPGIYSVGQSGKPAAHGEALENMAKSYMAKQNTIILTVIAAGTTVSTNRILEIVKPYNERALGILTKPDLVDLGGESELILFRLLQNSDPATYMKYGWHVLRNPKERETRDLDERDKNEDELFKAQPWVKIPRMNRGIKSLRAKLCRVLQDHVAQKLPEIENHIEMQISQLEMKLASYPERKEGDWLKYLLHLTKEFAQIAEQATGAAEKTSKFFDEFFMATPESYYALMQRNLRAQVRDMNENFITVLETCGCKHRIQWADANASQPRVAQVTTVEQEALLGKYRLAPSQLITQEDFESYIRTRGLRLRGNELPGVYISRMALLLFEDESRPWRRIASRHVQLVLDAAQSCVEAILEHITEHDEAARKRITETFIDPFFEDRRKALADKLEELLPATQRSYYPIADERAFMQQVMGRYFRRSNYWQDAINLHEKVDSDTALEFPSVDYKQQFLKDFITVKSSTAEQWDVQPILDYLLEFYAMNLEMFSRNVLTLAVEKQLMIQIPEIFTFEKVSSDLSTREQEALVEESDDLKDAREGLKKDLSTLREGRKLCQQWHKESSLKNARHESNSAHSAVNGFEMVNGTAQVGNITAKANGLLVKEEEY